MAAMSDLLPHFLQFEEFKRNFILIIRVVSAVWLHVGNFEWAVGQQSQARAVCVPSDLYLAHMYEAAVL